MSVPGNGGRAARAGRPGISALGRQRALLEFALASLLRRRGKTAVLCAVLTVIVFLLGSLAFLRSSIRLEAAAVLREAPDLVVQRQVAGRQELVPDRAVAAVREIPGVRRARGRLWGYYYDSILGANYTVLVPAEGGPAAEEALIGAGLARHRDASVEDIISLRSYRGEDVLFTVKQVLPEASEILTADLVLVSEGDFRTLFALPPDVANDIAVQLLPGADPDAVRGEALRVLPGAHVITRQEMLATAAGFFDWRGGLTAVIVLAMALALGIVAADKPAALGVEETQEMGILRALGWSTADVLAAKLWESLAVSLTALSAGILLAYVHVYLWDAALFAPILKGWAVLVPALRLIPDVDLGAVALIAGGTILLPAAGTLLACYRPAAGDPEKGIRDE